MFCHTTNAVGVNSGTSALWLALQGLGIGPGDQVITVPNTFIATAEAISFCGATPVFIDIDEKTYNMDPALIKAAITPQSRAIMPVHLFGQMADMDPILAIAREHDLYVIEDACQAHGAEYKGKRAGSLGDAGCFSFYPGKNLGAFGEGGAVVTNNDQLASTIRMLRDHGQSQKYHHERIGWNMRLEGLQGAILSVKLPYLSEWNDARRQHAFAYTRMLDEMEGIVTPASVKASKHIYHVYAIRAKRRDHLIDYLKANHISCGIHYPIPIHLQKAYAHLGLEAGHYPVAEACAREFISLPMYPELTHEQIEYVVDMIRNYVHEELLVL